MKHDEKLKTVEDIPLAFEENYHEEIRNRLRKHETMWTVELEEVGISEHRIGLIPDAKLLKSPSYHAGPKTRDLEQFEVEKQIKARVIVSAIRKWVAPVLLAPTKDDK